MESKLTRLLPGSIKCIQGRKWPIGQKSGGQLNCFKARGRSFLYQEVCSFELENADFQECGMWCWIWRRLLPWRKTFAVWSIFRQCGTRRCAAGQNSRESGPEFWPESGLKCGKLHRELIPMYRLGLKGFVDFLAWFLAFSSDSSDSSSSSSSDDSSSSDSSSDEEAPEVELERFFCTDIDLQQGPGIRPFRAR